MKHYASHVGIPTLREPPYDVMMIASFLLSFKS